jgi:hypothetical protein
MSWFSKGIVGFGPRSSKIIFEEADKETTDYTINVDNRDGFVHHDHHAGENLDGAL